MKTPSDKYAEALLGHLDGDGMVPVRKEVVERRGCDVIPMRRGVVQMNEPAHRSQGGGNAQEDGDDMVPVRKEVVERRGCAVMPMRRGVVQMNERAHRSQGGGNAQEGEDNPGYAPPPRTYNISIVNFNYNKQVHNYFTTIYQSPKEQDTTASATNMASDATHGEANGEDGRSCLQDGEEEASKSALQQLHDLKPWVTYQVTECRTDCRPPPYYMAEILEHGIVIAVGRGISVAQAKSQAAENALQNMFSQMDIDFQLLTSLSPVNDIVRSEEEDRDGENQPPWTAPLPCKVLRTTITEMTTDAPVDSLQVEDSDSRMEEEEPDEPDVPEGADALPTNNQLQFSTMNDENSNEGPAGGPGRKEKPDEPDVPEGVDALPTNNQLPFSTMNDGNSNEGPVGAPGRKEKPDEPDVPEGVGLDALPTNNQQQFSTMNDGNNNEGPAGVPGRKEKPDEPDVPEGVDALPTNNQLQFSTMNDENSNEEPAGVPGRNRTVTLNVSDSVANSPTPDILQVEDNDSRMEKEEPDEPDVPEGEDALPTNDEDDPDRNTPRKRGGVKRGNGRRGRGVGRIRGVVAEKRTLPQRMFHDNDDHEALPEERNSPLKRGGGPAIQRGRMVGLRDRKAKKRERPQWTLEDDPDYKVPNTLRMARGGEIRRSVRNVLPSLDGKARKEQPQPQTSVQEVQGSCTNRGRRVVLPRSGRGLGFHAQSRHITEPPSPPAPAQYIFQVIMNTFNKYI